MLAKRVVRHLADANVENDEENLRQLDADFAAFPVAMAPPVLEMSAQVFLHLSLPKSVYL